jgi:hypothetical protein
LPPSPAASAAPRVGYVLSPASEAAAVVLPPPAAAAVVLQTEVKFMVNFQLILQRVEIVYLFSI